MKKFVAGFLVGALLLVGTSTFADSVSLIGRKVEGTFTVKKDGIKVMDAVIINGKSYAPVRSIAEASGLSVQVEGKTIIMNSETPVLPPDRTPITNDTTANELLIKIENKKINIAELEKQVQIYEGLAKELENNGNLGKKMLESADRYRVYIAERQAELKVLEDALAEK